MFKAVYINCIAIAAIFTITVLSCFAQSPPKTSSSFYAEKLYIHTDRDTYVAGEDIWFKAYLLNARTNVPAGFSKNLYVEFISPDKKVVLQHMLRMQDKFTNGDFKLPDTLSAGKYLLRAYTGWMLNFDQDFVFEKGITINRYITSSSNLATSNVNNTKPTYLSNPTYTLNNITVQFFPEGGSLVAGVTSVVAVKAEDSNGHGIAVNGTINIPGNSAVNFNCDSTGMGIFSLKPEAGTIYKATVYYKNQPFHANLPAALNYGFVLNMSANSNLFTANIICNNATLNQAINHEYTLMVKHAGIMSFLQNITIQNAHHSILIPSNLPPGVNCVTLIDEEGRPLCERLIYVSNRPEINPLVIKTNKATYAPREPVSLTIKVDAKYAANMSVAVINAGAAKLSSNNILTYLDLSSEIKGYIDNPTFYFDTLNIHRFKQLDMLMLTQGWRDYIWRHLQQVEFVKKHDIEDGITITGSVRKVWSDKSLANMSITMYAPKATGQKLFSAVTDTAGKFKITGAEFYGYQFINFTSRTAVGKGGGWIRIDSLQKERLPIKWQPRYMDTYSINYNQDTTLKSTPTQRPFTLSGINQLNPVRVKDKSGVLQPQVFNISSAEHKEYQNLAQFLIDKIQGAYVEKLDRCFFLQLVSGFFINKGEKIFKPVGISAKYNDGSFVKTDCDANTPLSLSMESVVKLTVTPHQTPYGLFYTVALILRNGAMEAKNAFDNSVADVVGYYKARTFYSPAHNQPNTQPDLRTTIYWQPNVIPNKGEATINFYNPDNKGKNHIIVQGITSNGIPLYATTTYIIN